MRKRKKKYPNFITNFSILLIIFLIVNIIPKVITLPEEKKVKPKVESISINENIEYKVFGENLKKEINNISYEDIDYVEISKNKFNEIMNYKKFMGAIQNIDELRQIKRFTEKDVEKLRKHYIDTKLKVNYNLVNINVASEEELEYMGLSPKSIKKIKEHGDIRNIKELKKIIGKDYKNIRNSIYF